MYASAIAVLLIAACNRAPGQHGDTAASPSAQQSPAKSGEAAIPACSLLSKEEVGAIQGATIVDAKSGVTPSGKLVMAQCYYSSKEPNLAVSVTLIQPGNESSTGSEAKDYWADKFGRFEEESDTESATEPSERESGEEKEKAIPPKKIDGVGDGAFWSGNRFGGALYVLKKNMIVRVSVGGPGDEQSKINKSKAIAQKAIEHL
jgi:hypothetical protein